jgi:hypothetical protein
MRRISGINGMMRGDEYLAGKSDRPDDHFRDNLRIKVIPELSLTKKGLA